MEAFDQTICDNTFMLSSIGYKQGDNGQFYHESHPGRLFNKELLRISPTDRRLSEQELQALTAPGVLNLIGRYMEDDPLVAKRLCILLSETLRYFDTSNSTARLEVMTKMTRLALGRSVEHVGAAALGYIKATQPTQISPDFRRDIYDMSEAIADNDMRVQETAELGIAQMNRLRSFLSRRSAQPLSPANFTDITNGIFAPFPTIGAEFHFVNLRTDDTFWDRVALLNMSQYEQGSAIPFSATELGVVEIRMNPSFYPISIANWELIRKVLPEIDQSYFWVTISRGGRNFKKGEVEDDSIKEGLASLGRMCYLAYYENIPEATWEGQSPFGVAHYSQTVRFEQNSYVVSGDLDNAGQINVFTGFGELFPTLAYYLSMGLLAPDILQSLPRVPEFQKGEVKNFINDRLMEIPAAFSRLDRAIETDPILKLARDRGNQIIKDLAL